MTYYYSSSWMLVRSELTRHVIESSNVYASTE